MPTGVYKRKNEIKGAFKLGNTPHNKGFEKKEKLKKLEKFQKNLPIECKKHGTHLKWRIHSSNNIQCKICVQEWQEKRRKENPLKFLLLQAKRHAKDKKRTFEITLKDLEEVKEQQKNKCVYTNEEFNSLNPPSLDRVDSRKGYIKGNVQLINIQINRMKSDLDEERFLELCRKIAMSKAGKSKKKKK